MKRIVFCLFVILTAFVFSISGQTAMQRSFEKGMRSASRGEYRAALDEFKRSLALSKDERTDNGFLAKVHYNIGVCFYHEGQSANAVAEFETAVKLSGGNYENALYALGMAESALENWRRAEKAFLEALRLNSRNGETWFDLALVYLEKKDFETAVAAFQNSLRYKTSAAADAHNNLGVILALKGDFETAENEFRTALTISKNASVEARRNLEFCRFYRQNTVRDLIAGLQFSKRNEAVN